MEIAVNENFVAGQIRNVIFKGGVFKQRGLRPALIIQNDIGCIYSPLIWVIPFTSNIMKARRLPMHIFVPKSVQNGLDKDSLIVVEQSISVLRSEIKNLIGYLELPYIWECGNAWIKNCSMFSPKIINSVISETNHKYPIDKIVKNVV